jgi:hypothetical protein
MPASAHAIEYAPPGGVSQGVQHPFCSNHQVGPFGSQRSGVGIVNVVSCNLPKAGKQGQFSTFMEQAFERGLTFGQTYINTNIAVFRFHGDLITAYHNYFDPRRLSEVHRLSNNVSQWRPRPKAPCAQSISASQRRCHRH